jgi:hypothetical protein
LLPVWRPPAAAAARVTFSTLPDLSERYDPIFDRTIRSLSLD